LPNLHPELVNCKFLSEVDARKQGFEILLIDSCDDLTDTLYLLVCLDIAHCVLTMQMLTFLEIV